jgi:hypothetical protein
MFFGGRWIGAAWVHGGFYAYVLIMAAWPSSSAWNDPSLTWYDGQGNRMVIQAQA